MLRHAERSGLELTRAAAVALDRIASLPGSWNSLAEVAAWIYDSDPKLADWVESQAAIGLAGLGDFARLLLAERGDWTPAVLDSLRHLLGERNELLSGRAYLALSLCFSEEQPLGRPQRAAFEMASASTGKTTTPALNNIWIWFMDRFRLMNPDLLREWIAGARPGEKLASRRASH